MRRFLLAASMLVIGCSTDTFEGPDGGADGGDGGSSGGDAVATDASIDVASCAPTWCSIGAQPPGSFCTDFDESSALPDNWIQDAPNGSLNVVASPAEQCQSLHAHLGQVTGTSGAARLNHVATVVSTTSTHATLTLDVMLPKTDGGGLVFYFGIRTGTLSIGLVQRADGTWWLQSSLGTSSLTAPLASQGPMRGAFRPMVLDVTYQTSQVSATLTYRRADDNSDTIDANSAAISVGSTVSFLVGMNATTQTSSALDAYYDNVLTVLQ